MNVYLFNMNNRQNNYSKATLQKIFFVKSRQCFGC